MEADNEDDLKNKADLHIAGRHTALDISRFAEFFKWVRILPEIDWYHYQSASPAIT